MGGQVSPRGWDSNCNCLLSHLLQSHEITSRLCYCGNQCPNDVWAAVAKHTGLFSTPLPCLMVHCSLLTLYRCDDTTDSTSQTFYVGGINAFSQLQNASGHGNFVGMIRNLFVGSMLVNLGSPVREENTVHGALFTSKPVCGSEMTCDGPYHSGCLDYDFESHCICSGGFNSHACNKQESKCIPTFGSTLQLTFLACTANYLLCNHLL